MGSNTPLFEAIERLSATAGGRFHMPGHKGNPAALPAFSQVLPFDTTEVDGADNLQYPTGPIADSEANMARAYGSGATLYSAAGSTACVEAMLSLFVPAGGRVAMARNCHIAAVRTLAFLGATAIWMLPQDGRLTPATLCATLEKSPVDAVYLTSPDYYGRMSDIPALAAVCRKAGVPLLVDNAHGAHLRFLPGAPHPLLQGAAACCDSAHKTLPCLTPAALLHLADKEQAPAARRLLNLYSSTSPAYPVLLSLDLAAGLLLESPPDFAGAGNALGATVAAGPAGLVEQVDDILKACLYPAGAGVPYADALAALTNVGITPELHDGTRIVLMASPYNTAEDFAALAAALASLVPSLAPVKWEEPPLRLPHTVYGIREAVYAPQEAVAVANASGRVAAEVCAPCPPGIPVVVPGERVDEAAAAMLATGGIPSLFVVK